MAINSSNFSATSLATLGIVYGDIGTSPLYAIRQCFTGIDAISASRANVYGVLSLVFWSLVVIVSVKYVLVVMRQDNDGEGGIMALVALLRPLERRFRHARLLLVPLGLFGAALLYGDGSITPAISVLSAIEGLTTIDAKWQAIELPITIVILALLFLLQQRGTSRIGRLFGPVMLAWFLALAVLGIIWIARNPAVLAAGHPGYALEFFAANGVAAYLVLGTVFLVVTGGEAMYADLGHFGRGPIRLSWFAIVLPALLLNYFGQGALLLAQPDDVTHPFFHLAPEPWRLALLLLATAATIIASQAVISATFSLTAQAVQLGLLPRLRVIHTSADQSGQIYVPFVNWSLMIATIALTLSFRSSDGLGAAYGLAVSLDMVITSVLAGTIAWRYGSRPWFALALFASFLCVDLAFLGANLFKFVDGGWYPLAVGCGIFAIMSTWRRGRAALNNRLGRTRMTFEKFSVVWLDNGMQRVPGAAVFLAPDDSDVPPVLIHHLSHHHVLHETVILLTIRMEDRPQVSATDRIELRHRHLDCYRIVVHYGYLQTPNIPVALRLWERSGVDISLKDATYYVGREMPVLTQHGKSSMAAWRERLFAFLERNSVWEPAYYGIPSERVVELGMQVEV